MVLPPLGARGFTLASWNVLLPNSVDGWWVYKMYGPNVPEAATTWEARSQLVQRYLLAADADIIALQETCADSFASDFSFLLDGGYDFALHSKGRMRPATLWKRARFRVCEADGGPLDAGCTAESRVVHADRTLTVPLAAIDESGAPLASPPLFIVNCHLCAGAEARRRLRQVHEAIDAIRKARGKREGQGKAEGKAEGNVEGKAEGKAEGNAEKGQAEKGKTEEAAIVVCGDFNSQGASAVRELLCAEQVLPSFREAGDPTESDQAETEVTSKPKKQPFGPFFDVALAACREEADVPPTLVCPSLVPKMRDAITGGPSEALLEALVEMFAKLSADGERMTAEEQERWFTLINKQVGRGEEYRNAVAACQARGSPDLTKEDFVEVYAKELRNGYFWGIEHDLRVVRGHGLEDETRFTARFDYVYATARSLRLHSVHPALEPEKMAELLEGKAQLPNEWFPSDHLPVAVALEWLAAPPSSQSV